METVETVDCEKCGARRLVDRACHACGPKRRSKVPELSACPHCGSLRYASWTRCRNCQDNDLAMPHTYGIHRPDVTEMRVGGWRAECGCGDYSDFETEHQAIRWLARHIQHAKGSDKATRSRRSAG